jgi:hypothetical protein
MHLLGSELLCCSLYMLLTVLVNHSAIDMCNFFFGARLVHKKFTNGDELCSCQWILLHHYLFNVIYVPCAVYYTRPLICRMLASGMFIGYLWIICSYNRKWYCYLLIYSFLFVLTSHESSIWNCVNVQFVVLIPYLVSK